MGAFIVKQPNGRYCRFSTIVDTVTDINMTEEDYINLCMERAKKEALEILQEAKPFKILDAYFYPNTNTRKEFEQLKQHMCQPDTPELKWEKN